MKLLHFIPYFLGHTVKLWKTVAVVEYWSVPDVPKETLNKNADNYIEIIEELSRDYQISVIVFPEGTLNNIKKKKDLLSYGTKINFNEDPCRKDRDKYPTYLQKLSCAANYNKVTIVFNLIQVANYDFYSSDVVIGPDGLIAFSVKKEHRIGDRFLHHKPIALSVPINLLFYVSLYFADLFIPVARCTVTSAVTGFEFSHEKMLVLDSRFHLVCSNWISELPFLTSLQVYQMWAQEFGVTILFSGANNPKRGQGGTGIYHATGGPLLMDIATSTSTQMYVYNFSDEAKPGFMVTPMLNKSADELAYEMDAFTFRVDPDLHRYSSIILDERQSYSNQLVCYNKTKGNNFCCRFVVQLSIDESVQANSRYVYRLVAYKGYKTYYRIFKTGGIEVCGVIACLNASFASCGLRFENYGQVQWPLTFEQLNITSSFALPQKEGIYKSSQFPNSLLSSMRPLHPSATTWTSRIVNNETLERTFALAQPQNRLLVFAIFGRNYTLVDPRSGYLKQSSFFVFILTSAIIALFCNLYNGCVT